MGEKSVNQILITKKLYVTPELRRKKKWYKFQCAFAILLVCLLFSYYIYAEYDRTASEEVSQEILAAIQSDSTIKKVEENDVIVVAMSEQIEAEPEPIPIVEEEPVEKKVQTTSGEYNIEAVLNIPRLEINYPVLAETSEELLKISVNKYWGPAPNEVGNYCIVGHNYKNKTMFGRLNEITNGDVIELTDNSGRTITYTVYDRYVVEPTDTRCTSQLTNGKREITLITCTNYGQQRLIVKGREK